MYCFKLKPNFLYSILGQPCWFCNYQIHSICMLTCSRSLTRQVAKKKVSRKKVFLVLFPSPVSLRVCLCIRPRQALTKTCAFLSLHCFCAWHRDCQNRFQSFIHTRRYSERPGRVDIWVKLNQRMHSSTLSPKAEMIYSYVFFYFKKLPPYTLVGFDLTTQSSSLLVGRWRRYH
jgi:hypothetical protein